MRASTQQNEPGFLVWVYNRRALASAKIWVDDHLCERVEAFDTDEGWVRVAVVDELERILVHDDEIVTEVLHGVVRVEFEEGAVLMKVAASVAGGLTQAHVPTNYVPAGEASRVASLVRRAKK